VAEALALGLDIGTSRIKACLVDAQGAIIATSAVNTPFRAMPDGIEMSADDLFRAVSGCLASLGGLLSNVACVGIATMGETGGIIADGRVSRVPLLAWHDPRGATTVEHLTTVFRSNLHSRTGRRIRTVSSVAKLGWLAAHGADLSGEWTGVGGLIAWRLAGKVAQEESLAATSGAFDPFTGEWDRDIIREAGLSTVGWPKVLSATDPVGTVTTGGAAWSGLPSGIPVCIAGHDHPVGVVGVGARRSDIVDSMGTGEPLITGWAGERSDMQALVTGLPIEGEITITRWPGSRGLMLVWELLQPGLAREHLSAALGRSQADLDDEALRYAGDSQPFSPQNLRDLEQLEPVGLDKDAAVEYWDSTLAGYADSASRAEEWVRSKGSHDETLLIGGGLRSPAWIRHKVMRARRKPLVVDHPESVAYGAALLGAVPAHLWTPATFPRAVRHDVFTLLPASYVNGVRLEQRCGL
jgi:xylulokinase